MKRAIVVIAALVIASPVEAQDAGVSDAGVRDGGAASDADAGSDADSGPALPPTPSPREGEPSSDSASASDSVPDSDEGQGQGQGQGQGSASESSSDSLLSDDDLFPEGGDMGDIVESDEDLAIPEVVAVATAIEDETPEDTGGAVQRLDEELLDRFNYDNAEAVIQQVPGAYSRSEDGYGLRPNIGLRGVSSERSSRITLMEDGVLFGPAPYAAPAAYYFPMMTRMTGVDVYMGAATIPYGPTTVGGAIDLRGRDIPRDPDGGLDLALGTTWYGRMHAWGGASNDWGGLLGEGVYIRSDGFKRLDGSPDADTGFDRAELLVRGELRHALGPDAYQRLELRLGLAGESSNETYLGLTDADFAVDPNRRYVSSSLDHMGWWRTQAQLRHRLEIGEGFTLRTIAYRHDLDREWNKVNAVGGLPAAPQVRLDPHDILTNPTGGNGVLAAVLRGEIDSEGLATSNDYVLIGANARRFGVTGIQSDATGAIETGPLAHVIRGGVRLHHDSVDRHHTEDAYAMQGGALQRATEETYDLLRTHAEALALSAYAAYALTIVDAVTITPGARAELIWTSFRDELADAESQAFRWAILPGASATWQIVPEVAVFAGVMRGFAPVAPGQAASVRAEDSVNYELGGRFTHAASRTSAQLTGFVNDYQVFLQQCSFASGCADEGVDDQANGGAPIVAGVDARIGTSLAIDDVRVPLRAAYTFTYTELREEVDSTHPQFVGGVPGDHLPYVPEHQLNAQVGLELREFGLNVSGSFVSAMWESVGHGDDDPALRTDPSFLLDASAYVRLFEELLIYVRGENLTYTQSIASRRPFGARPTRPFQIQVGLRVGL